MQYIWEVVLAAEKNGIREADLQYEVPEVRSPYLEVSFYDLNTQTVEQTAVEVNPFYRFFDIFSGVLDIDQSERIWKNKGNLCGCGISLSGADGLKDGHEQEGLLF